MNIEIDSEKMALKIFFPIGFVKKSELNRIININLVL